MSSFFLYDRADILEGIDNEMVELSVEKEYEFSEVVVTWKKDWNFVA